MCEIKSIWQHNKKVQIDKIPAKQKHHQLDVVCCKHSTTKQNNTLQAAQVTTDMDIFQETLKIDGHAGHLCVTKSDVFSFFFMMADRDRLDQIDSSNITKTHYHRNIKIKTKTCIN